MFYICIMIGYDRMVEEPCKFLRVNLEKSK